MRLPGSILFLACVIAANASAESSTCVVGSTIIDVVRGGRMSGRTVVVEGERIELVTEATLEELNCDVQVEANGKYLIPGLWDMHVHGTNRAYLWPIYIANGVTGVRDMFGASDREALRAQLAAAATKPRVHMSGALIDGPPGIYPGSTLVTSADEARKAVNEQVAAGADFIKVYQLLSREAYFAITEETGKLGLPAAGHVPSSVSAREASEAGQVSIEHLIDVGVSCSADEDVLRASPARSFMASRERDAEAYQSFDAAKCKELVQVFLRNGTWMVPTLALHHSESHEHQTNAVEKERLLHFDAETRSWLLDEPPMSDADHAVLKDALDADMKLVSFLHREGVPFLAGTDALNPYTFPGFSLHDELALLVESGLTPLAALKAATVNAARYLGREDELGSIEAGNLADLVLLDADPLVDIRNTTKIAAVFSNGKYFDRGTLEELLVSARAYAADQAE